MAKQNRRTDHEGPHRQAYEKNRRRVLATQDVCGICGQPVNKSLPSTHPLGPVVDHIIPISRGGHPSDMDNLQLAHNFCNSRKGRSMPNHGIQRAEADPGIIPNNVLPQSRDWRAYRSGDDD